MKRNFVRICAAALLSLLLLGCQPTPEKEAIVSPKANDISSLPITEQHEEIQTPTVLEESRVSSSGALEIDFSAEIGVPKASAYSVYEVTQRSFSDKEVLNIFRWIHPEAELILEPDYTKDQWMRLIDEYDGRMPESAQKEERLEQWTQALEEAPVLYTPVPFSFSDIQSGEPYRAYFANDDGMYGSVYGKKDGSSLCYLRDAELSYYRQDILLPGEDAALLKDYEGEFPISEEAALERAKQALEACGLGDMQLIDSEKMCIYRSEMLVSKGWDFIFTHGADGLPAIFDFMGATYGGKDLPLPTLCSPWGEEAALISVDEQGILCIDLRNIIQYGQRLAENVRLMPFDEIKEIVAQHLVQTYAYAAEQIPDSRITITKMELCMSLVSAKDDYFAGRLIPSWLVFFEYSGKNQDAHTDEAGNVYEATTFANKSSRYFSAIDGSYIEPRITRDMLE